MCSIEVDSVKTAIALLYAVEKNLLVLKKYFFSKIFHQTHVENKKKSGYQEPRDFVHSGFSLLLSLLEQIPDLKKFEVEVIFVKNEHKTFDCTKKLENFYWFEV